MDPCSFDSLARSLAASRTRRGFLGSLAALGAGILAARTGDAQVSQAQCGNVICRTNPGVCRPGCVCCVFANGNSRCMPPGNCTGVITSPTTTTTAAPTTTTTTAAPTTTTTTTAPCPPGLTLCGEACVDTRFDRDNCGTCGNACPDAPIAFCDRGVCCQPLTGFLGTCSATLPCCGTNHRCEGGQCCGGTGVVTCYTDGDSCCNQCIPFDSGCVGHCPGACS